MKYDIFLSQDHNGYRTNEQSQNCEEARETTAA